MNADREMRWPGLTRPSKVIELEAKKVKGRIYHQTTDVHWRWRLQAAESIASNIDPQRFGVVGFYIFGSVNNATAGPESDIDLLIHFRGTAAQRENLLTWLDGWNSCLSTENYQHTGYKISSLLDVHLVTDDDIQEPHQLCDQDWRGERCGSPISHRLGEKEERQLDQLTGGACRICRVEAN